MPGDRSEQDVESDDKFVPVIIGASGAIKKGLDQNLHLTPRSDVGHRTTYHTNEHCTRHLSSAG